MHKCDRCQTLEDEVAYLRLRLADRLNANLVRIVYSHFGFTPAEANLVAALYQARSVMPVYDLELAVKRDDSKDYAMHANTVPVLVSRIRKKTSVNFIDTFKFNGFSLSDGGRLQVAQAVETERLAVRPEVSPEPQDDPSDLMRPQWTRERRARLQHLLRRDGLTYDEAARAMRVSRGAIASAAARFGYQSATPS